MAVIHPVIALDQSLMLPRLHPGQAPTSTNTAAASCSPQLQPHVEMASTPADLSDSTVLC